MKDIKEPLNASIKQYDALLKNEITEEQATNLDGLTHDQLSIISSVSLNKFFIAHIISPYAGERSVYIIFLNQPKYTVNDKVLLGLDHQGEVITQLHPH